MNSANFLLFKVPFLYLLGLGEQFSIPETSGALTRVEIIRGPARGQEDSLEKLRRDYPLELKDKQLEPKRKAYDLPQNMSPSPKKLNQFGTLEGQLHLDPRFIEEGHSRLFSASNERGVKLEGASNRDVPDEMKNMDLSFQEDYIEYLGVDNVDDELNDNSALLDES